MVRVRLMELSEKGFDNVQQELRGRGFGVKSEEYYLSKQNHELRGAYKTVGSSRVGAVF